MSAISHMLHICEQMPSFFGTLHAAGKIHYFYLNTLCFSVLSTISFTEYQTKTILQVKLLYMNQRNSSFFLSFQAPVGFLSYPQVMSTLFTINITPVFKS